MRVICAFLLLSLMSGLAGGQEYAQKVNIIATPIPLNEEEPNLSQVGKLRYVKGWALKGDHHQFGGFSALRILDDEDGAHQLVSINDSGLWLRAAFDLAANASPLAGATLTWQRPLPEYAEKKQDTESIVVLDDGYLLGIEQIHRIMKVDVPGTPAVRSPMTDYIDFRQAGKNGGLEAMTRLKDGRILAFLENGRDPQGRSVAYLLTEDRGETLFFSLPENFRPTDATTLPNGDVLLVTRFYSFLDGVAAKVFRFSAAGIEADAELEGEEIATLRPPFSVDNMEGLDTLTLDDGRTLVLMISDDNFRAMQRTLLMVFELLP